MGNAPICEECGHPISAHGKYGCEIERGDAWVTGNQADQPTVLMAQGPCGCEAWEVEELSEAEVEAEKFECECGQQFETYARFLDHISERRVGPHVQRHRGIYWHETANETEADSMLQHWLMLVHAELLANKRLERMAEEYWDSRAGTR